MNTTQGDQVVVQQLGRLPWVAVEKALRDEEWSQLSDRALGEMCAVSGPFVASIRRPEIAERQHQARVAHAAKLAGECNPIAPVAPAGAASEPASSAEKQAFAHTGYAQAAAESEAIAAVPQAAPAPSATAGQLPPAPPSDAAAPAYTELDAARDQIADLQAALSLANLGDVLDEDRNQAAELIEHLQGEVKGLTAQLRTVTSSRDFLMQENTHLKQQLASQRREIDRLKAVAA